MKQVGTNSGSSYSSAGSPSSRNRTDKEVSEIGHSRISRFFKILGPGLITGASDDDPSGIGTYAMAGPNSVMRRFGPRS